MTDKELLIKRLELINRQQAKIEDLTERLESAIAGQETLQKALADKGREVSVLKSDLKLLRNDYDYLKEKFDKAIEKNIKQRDKIVRLTAEKDSLIKTFGECQAEAVKEFAELSIKRICENVTAPTPTESYVVERCNQEIDNLVKEMVGDTE